MRDQKKEIYSGEFVEEFGGDSGIFRKIVTKYTIEDGMITYENKVNGKIKHSIKEDMIKRLGYDCDKTYDLVKIDLNETGIHRMLTKHSNAGYIIVSAFRGDRSLADNYKRHKDLERHITKSNNKYSYIPVWGGFIEKDDDGNELRDVKEKSFIITNFPQGSSKPYSEHKGLWKLGRELIRKYDQDSFLFKPMGKNRKIAYLINKNGRPDDKYSVVSPAVASDIYFTNLRKSSRRFGDKDGKSFAYRNEYNLYMAKPPLSVSEAWTRYRETFFLGICDLEMYK